MKVVLERDWFSPDSFLYEAGPVAVDIPDEHVNRLPPTAKIISKDTYVPKPLEVDNTLRDLDELRASTDVDSTFKRKPGRPPKTDKE